MAIFAAVVRTGSVRGAAGELRVTPSAVSQQVRQLEEDLGVALFGRAGRRLSLTDAGAAFYQGCAEMIRAAARAREDLAAYQHAPIGELSICAPTGLSSLLAQALRPFLARSPKLSLRMVVTDEALDLVRDRIDLAISISRPLRDSSLVRRHLADWPLILCAAPAYLQRRGTPHAPGDLARHDLLALPPTHHPTDVLTGADGQEHRVAVKPRVVSNNQGLIRQLTLEGAGLSFQTAPEIRAELGDGRLIRVLPDWATQALSVDALMPARNPQPAKVRMALDVLKEHFAPARPGS
jgi:LysR family transcriptional regulator, transcriptional activator for aaeXAB operon